MAKNKAITFLKQYFFLLALLATFVGFSAFKASTNKRSLKWYTITTSHPSNQQLDVIGNETGNPNQGGCSESVQQVRCAIQLDNPNDEDLFDMTVQEALSEFPELNIEGRTYRSTP